MKLNQFCMAAPLLLGACATPGTLPTGEAAYAVIPEVTRSTGPDLYQIGPLDVLKISVFQEPDLSLEEAPVDAGGNIVFPLIGQVRAAGKTSIQLGEDIAERLEARYLVDPQVNVIVSRSASQKITVEGAVKSPGVFEIEGPTSLLQAIALSQGPTETARLGEIIIFREKEDGTYGARFNLSRIRRGQEPNPVILSGDIVVVGNSFAKQVFRDFLQLSPLLSTVFIRLN